MKVKCINNEHLPVDEYLTVGKVYETMDSFCYNEYHIADDQGRHFHYNKERFVVFDLEDELKAAKDLIISLEAQIQEEKDLNKLEIGQMYQHEQGCVYMIAEVKEKFVLVCIKSEKGYAGSTYTEKSYNNIKDIFGGCKVFFKLLK